MMQNERQKLNDTPRTHMHVVQTTIFAQCNAVGEEKEERRSAQKRIERDRMQDKGKSATNPVWLENMQPQIVKIERFSRTLFANPLRP